ncbi:hypothetical protein EOL73_00015 [Candidatus Saccharibacteria bacterium]|nr:hypothetical protein [Candidatus Saccharibacteria bacterium]
MELSKTYDKEKGKRLIRLVVAEAESFSRVTDGLTVLLRENIARAGEANEVKELIAETREALVSALKDEYGDTKGVEIWEKMAASFKTIASRIKKEIFGSEAKKDKKTGYVKLTIEYIEKSKPYNIALQISELLSNHVASDIYVELSKILAENSQKWK